MLLQTIALCLLAVAQHGNDENPMRDLIQNSKVGVLSTLYKGRTPYGSTAPYVLNDKGEPVFFLSDMAQHTKNIKWDENGSLTVYKEDANDAFNSPRITVMGKLKKLTHDERKQIQDQYLKKYPEAKAFIDFGDFNFYKLEPERIHYIGGFGDINWLTPEQYRKEIK